MTLDEAAKLLSEAYHAAAEGEKVVQIHLFGIHYAEQIANFPASEIATRAGIGRSFGTESSKGRKLAKYVQVRG